MHKQIWYPVQHRLVFLSFAIARAKLHQAQYLEVILHPCRCKSQVRYPVQHGAVPRLWQELSLVPSSAPSSVLEFGTHFSMEQCSFEFAVARVQLVPSSAPSSVLPSFPLLKLSLVPSSAPRNVRFDLFAIARAQFCTKFRIEQYCKY